MITVPLLLKVTVPPVFLAIASAVAPARASLTVPLSKIEFVAIVRTHGETLVSVSVPLIRVTIPTVSVWPFTSSVPPAIVTGPVLIALDVPYCSIPPFMRTRPVLMFDAPLKMSVPLSNFVTVIPAVLKLPEIVVGPVPPMIKFDAVATNPVTLIIPVPELIIRQAVDRVSAPKLLPKEDELITAPPFLIPLPFNEKINRGGQGDYK